MSWRTMSGLTRKRSRTARAATRQDLDADEIRARRARETVGRLSEWVAAALLWLAGYRLLARRHRTPYGEIDLIAVRGTRVAFVEVKQRRTLLLARAALSGPQTARLYAAAEHWIKHRPRYQAHQRGFDAVLISPRALPLHLPDVLQPAITRRAF